MADGIADRAERPMFVLLAAGVGCFLLSLVVMGIAPWTTLAGSMEPPPGFVNPYEDENGEPTAAGRGRKTYIAEGCWHCHSQFVRPIANEPNRYGPKSEAWEAMFDVPNTYGTRRIGPDLSREAGRRTDDWHFAHLHNPRSTVPTSVMPSYPWLFEETAEGATPTEKARDLVAYLQTLGRAFEDDIVAMAFPAELEFVAAKPATEAALEHGEMLFNKHCTGCHGDNTDGEGKASDFLAPSAADLNTRYLPPGEAYRVLHSGVRGTSMPSFAELSEKDLWALAHYVSKLGQAVETANTGAVDAALATRGKEVYDKSCAACHGKDGVVAMQTWPRPKDLRTRLYSRDYFDKVLREGRPGTTMVPLALSDDERKAVYEYVRSLYGGK